MNISVRIALTNALVLICFLNAKELDSATTIVDSLVLSAGKIVVSVVSANPFED